MPAMMRMNDAPILIFIIVRVFGGVLLTLYYHIVKGFTLYDDLPEKYIEEAKHHGSWLTITRRLSLFLLIFFAIYLTVSLICLIKIGGLDGAQVRRRGNNHRFNRVPFGSLLFADGLDCAICMDRFSE